MGRCTFLKRYVIVPITSLLTIGLVGYISWVYLDIYCAELTDVEAIFSGGTFIIFPILIYTSLLRILLGNPGQVTKELQSKILRDNGIDESDIGTEYTIEQVLEILNENYLINNGMLPKIDNGCDQDNSPSNLITGPQQLEMTEISESTEDSQASVSQSRQERIELALQMEYRTIQAPANVHQSFQWRKFLNYRYCKKCDLIKPPRAHHCSLCDKCVLKMDHHCPWVGNCVGHYNHKFFVQFLIYTTFGCTFVSLTMGVFSLGDDINDMMFQQKGSIVMASGLSTTLILCLSILLVTHIYFIISSGSSLESAAFGSFNPFHEPTAKQLGDHSQKTCIQKLLMFSKYNFYQVFGLHGLHWYLPLSIPQNKITCDGINWKLRKLRSEQVIS